MKINAIASFNNNYNVYNTKKEAVQGTNTNPIMSNSIDTVSFKGVNGVVNSSVALKSEEVVKVLSDALLGTLKDFVAGLSPGYGVNYHLNHRGQKKMVSIVRKLNDLDMPNVDVKKVFKDEPIFELLDAQRTESIMQKLSNNDDILEDFLLTKNINGDTALYDCGYYKANLLLNGIKNNENLVKRGVLEKFILSKNAQGNMALYKAEAPETEAILRSVEDNPDLLRKALLERNMYDGTILHNADDEKTRRILNIVLKRSELIKDNDFLTELYTTRDYFNARIIDSPFNIKRNIHKEFLEEHPEVLERIGTLPWKKAGNQ